MINTIIQHRVALPGLALVLGCTFAISVAAQQSPTSPRQGGGPRPQGLADNTRAGGGSGSASSSSSGVQKGGGAGYQVLSADGGQAAEPGARVVALDNAAFDPIRDRPLEFGALPESAQNATISLQGPMKALDFLESLAMATGWNIVASPGVVEIELSFFSRKMTPEQAAAILRFSDLYYRYDEDDNFLYVMTKNEYLGQEFGEIMKFEYTVRYANLIDVETVLGTLLSPKGRLIADPRSSRLIAYDTADNIQHMEEMLRELDVVRESRTYELAHINVDAVFETLEMLLSEKGQMTLDPRSNTLVAFDRPERLDTIGDVINSLDRELETRSWVLRYADPDTVAEQIADLIPEEMGVIAVNEEIHQITVTATPWRLEEIAARIYVWDAKRRQVQIEAYLATVSTSVAREIGFQWDLDTTVSGDPLTASLGSDLTDAVQSVTLDSNRLDVTMKALDKSGDATILAHPRITVQDGEEASFKRNTEVPFSQSTTRFSSNVGDNLNTVSQISFIDVGTTLRVLPRISSDDNILLDIEAEDSTFEIVQFTSNDSVNEVPQKTKSLAETQVMVKNGETLVLGGLRISNSSDDVNRVPILGELPIIGFFFRSSRTGRDDAELLVFITPTIMDETTSPETEALVAFDDRDAENQWDDQKSALERAMDTLDGKRNEIRVAIGASGAVAVNGERTTLTALRTSWLADPYPARKVVVVRTHPSAPEDVALKVMNSAMEAGMKLKHNDRSFNVVPTEPVE